MTNMGFNGFSRERKKVKEPVARLVPSLQFRRALSGVSPVLEVLAEQDKIRMQHYVPLHPYVVDALLPLVRNRRDEKAMFTHQAFDDCLRGRKIPLARVNAHFVRSDLRKFAEQYGDVLQWD